MFDTKNQQSGVLKSGSRPTAPSVFDYLDYRDFLRDAFDRKRERNPSFTESAFVRKVGLSSNSRGYFKLVVRGKRNLSSSTIRGFAEALDLSAPESMHFENLVLFNQASQQRDKNYYLERLTATAGKAVSKQLELSRAQFSFYAHWYLTAVRQLVGLPTFQEDPAWIASMLRNKISKAQAVEAMIHLERLGMIRRNAETQRWEQSEALIKYVGNVYNEAAKRFQIDMVERTREALEDPYAERRMSSVTLSCSREHLPEMIQMIDEFRDALNLRFGLAPETPDTVFQLGFQVFQLTPVKPSTPEKKEK